MKVERSLEPVQEHVVDIGHRLKAARQGRFTVKGLAEAAGVSAGLISEVERGQGNPSFRTLYRVSQALGLRVGDLLSAEDGDRAAAARIVRSDKRKKLQLGDNGLQWELLTPDLQCKLEVLKTAIPPGFSNEGAPFQHVGEECVHLHEGFGLEVTVDGELFVLMEGDTITYDSGKTHWWSNPTDTPATVIGVVTPPSF